MGTIQILQSEGAAFRKGAEDVAMFEPRHRTRGPFEGKHLGLGDGRAVDLSGLDYLALGSAPRVKQLMVESLTQHDCGIPGSEAIIQMEQTHALEEALSRYHLGGGAALTFSAGYGTNFSVMEALGLRTRSHFIRLHQDVAPMRATTDVPTLFFMDGDLHFSARHGIRFARKLQPEACAAYTYRTGDAEHLELLLRQSLESHGDRAVRIILTDTVESATGREFDMATLCRLAESYDCMLYADEAHAVGALGPQGRGITAKVKDFERYRERLMLMGTLTKVFCQPGGYVVMRDAGLARLLKFCSPQHVFSAPIAPWVASATVKVLELVAGEHGERRREQVRRVSRQVRERLEQGDFELVSHTDTPILAIPLRNARVGTQVLEFMRREGFIISVFQAPLMPVGREVLRLAMRADLDEEDMERLLQALIHCRETLRFTAPA
ncbi:aminotransferase class I/II-fold pyridoxal phosphate-dependent enzyme [Myxococcus qinghaiensis]|uniref:aminotransferase class I/II-fold pyridoxal phosphate-dependent enzyme n=1 Tax=Myxococcus qinghaiensis TaxID=2906758 RepID=UPI0020A83678|nr:aminotransferase class I/II-fold pyridoxal phosphate-dependent enzyme [Myxococcus qinghaiensis]MCP3166348.1 aminotransferase class I/II-fold pyridoxal phosphate-dependent enzyme [Myxococcus qinghaiensis]